MSLLNDLAPKLLRWMDAERAHSLTISALKTGAVLPKPVHFDPALGVKIGNLSLPAPLGLAAGFDKNAEVPMAMSHFGFGWLECGTVTPYPQAGNPKPRLFRLPRDHAVINRLGFNNQGLAVFAENLRAASNCLVPAGANIGANKDSHDRVADYCTGLQKLWGLPSWFTINISSPNTPGLRELQSSDALSELLERVAGTRDKLSKISPAPPVFLKVAPDLDEAQIEQITKTALQYSLDGLIVSNTTLARPDSLASRYKSETGGLSGAPLFTVSTRVLGLFYQAAKGELPLIGVGGIGSVGEAWQKIRAGASALQLYSAMVYGGPGLPARIHAGLLERLRAEGVASITEMTGVDQSF